MKKLVLGIALLAMIALSVYAQQYCPENHFRAEPIWGGRAVQITGYVGNNWHVRIPHTIRGLPVVSIWDDAFRRRNLISITLPDTVLIIGSGAFADNQLTSITLPKAGMIGQGAFAGNPLARVDVTIHNGLTYIMNYAFFGAGLTSVTIPDSITSIGNWAFYRNRLTSVAIPDSITSIGNRAFYDNRLTSITIPDSVTYIGDRAFARNQLTNVTIPDSVTIIRAGAFRDNQLVNITIPRYTRILDWQDRTLFDSAVAGPGVTVTRR